MGHSFDDWIVHIFDYRLVSTTRYWTAIDKDARWDGLEFPTGSTLFVSYITQAFENAESVFRRFSDGQLNQGLWYIASNGAGEYIFHVLDESVPLSDRQRCVRSFFTLYEQLFQKRCSPHLSHLDEVGKGGEQQANAISPLNLICYMWYDVIPIYGKPDDPIQRELAPTFLEVLGKTLTLSSIACQEGALHGLGHWQRYYPKQVIPIIDKFLADNPADNPQVSLELREYALVARTGGVR